MSGVPALCLDRRAAVKALLAERAGLLVVTGLGSPSWDCAAAGDDPRNFYLWGAMGSAITVGLGLALAQPSQRVLVLTGDGEMLMGIGGLATAAVQRPGNLAVVVLDNERYGETGMQDTHTARGVDLCAFARAAGFRRAALVRTAAELADARALVYQEAGPNFVQVKIATEPVPLVLPPRDGAFLRDRFRAAVLEPARRA
jgi:thiamine pyrophosphate-dependent acetolactate synthase large subunit-like protein